MKDYSICVIGNSHAAALNMAWKKRLAPVTSGVSFTFFAAMSQHLRQLEFEDGVLSPATRELSDKLAATSGGRTRIKLSQYDAFVLAGLGVRIALPALCEDHGIVDHLKWGPVKYLVSRNCFDAMIRTAFADNLAFDLLDIVRKVSKRPVLICPTPYRTETDLEKPSLRDHRRLRDAKFRGLVVENAMRVADDVAARRKGEVLWQEESTIGTPGYTKAEFARGALRLEKTGDDGMHMNEDFGYLTVVAILRKLDEMTNGDVLGADTVVPFTRARKKSA